MFPFDRKVMISRAMNGYIVEAPAEKFHQRSTMYVSESIEQAVSQVLLSLGAISPRDKVTISIRKEETPMTELHDG